MAWEIEFTDEFYEWWSGLSEAQQDEISAIVEVLEREGTKLGAPRTSKIQSSKYGQMRELKVQMGGDPFRVLYAFDPRRVAMLLHGGNKKGDDDWYEKNVPVADRIFGQHLEELKNENKGEKHG